MERSPLNPRLLILAGLALAGLLILGTLFRAEQIPRADFVLANGADPKSLDPARVSSAVEGRILRALFEGLLTEDPVSLEPRPGVAASWEVRADGCLYRFTLRENARWSNGDPVTAADFEWSWRRLLAPETVGQYADLLWSVVGAEAFHEGHGPWSGVGIRAVSDRVLEVELDHPVSYFLNLMAFFPLVPLHRPSVEAAEARGVSFTTPDRLVGNGPFRLETRLLRDRIRVIRNPHYWDGDSVNLDSVDYLSVENANTQLNLFLSGQADWVAEVPRPVVPVLLDDPRYARSYRPTPYLATYFYRFNTTREPFDDPEVRRALSLATDRAEIVERVTRAGEEVAWSFVPWPRAAVENYAALYESRTGAPPGVVTPCDWYRRALVVDARGSQRPWRQLGYDPAAARNLLESKGFRMPRPDGSWSAGRPFPEFEILYNSSPLHERVAEVIQAQWSRELGIRVRLANQEWGSYLSSQQALEYDVSRSSWIGDYLDPETFLGIFQSGAPNNRTGWSHDAYDRALAAARLETDRTRRAQLLEAAEAILLEELPVLPLFYNVTEGLLAEGFTGVGGNALNTLLPKHFARTERPR